MFRIGPVRVFALVVLIPVFLRAEESGLEANKIPFLQKQLTAETDLFMQVAQGVQFSVQGLQTMYSDFRALNIAQRMREKIWLNTHFPSLSGFINLVSNNRLKNRLTEFDQADISPSDYSKIQASALLLQNEMEFLLKSPSGRTELLQRLGDLESQIYQFTFNVQKQKLTGSRSYRSVERIRLDIYSLQLKSLIPKLKAKMTQDLMLLLSEEQGDGGQTIRFCEKWLSQIAEKRIFAHHRISGD